MNILSLSSWKDVINESKISLENFAKGFSGKIQSIYFDWGKGWAAKSELVLEGVIFLACLLTWPFAWSLGKKIQKSCYSWRLNRARGNYQFSRKSKRFRYLRFWEPQIPYVVMGLNGLILYQLLKITRFSELRALLPFYFFFLLYRIGTYVFKRVLLFFSERGESKLRSEVKKKAQRHAKILGLLCWAFLSFKYLAAVVLGRGEFYQTYKQITYSVFFVSVVLIFYSWRKNLYHVVKRIFTSKTEKVLLFLLRDGIALIGSPLVASYLFLLKLWDWAFDWLEEIPWVKALSAKLLHRKLLEEENKVREYPPEDYQDVFLEKVEQNSNLFIPTPHHLLQTCVELIKLWAEEKSEENSLCLYGEKGAGKTTLLNILEKNLKQIESHTISLDQKHLNRVDLYKRIGEALGIELNESMAPLLQYDSQGKKTVIILDEGQNLFLSDLGGFEGIKSLFELMSAPTSNIFWCVSFNLYAWNYLSLVFRGQNHFRQSLYLKGWTDEGIKNLIMIRHSQQSKYTLDFNDLQDLTSFDEENSSEYIEDQYFKLLWERSKGNPRVALHLWLRSLDWDKKELFRVGIPVLTLKQLNIQELSDDEFFVYAAIIKHENLAIKEIVRVTRLEEGIVRNAIKKGLENEFLIRKTVGGYCVKAIHQQALIQYLKGKNFIYV